MKTIKYGDEYMKMEEGTGNISRPATGMPASGNWRVLGAVRFNNFGHIVERKSLMDIVAGEIKEWQYKNGKQKWHVRDFDHTGQRIWMSPKHSIF